MLQVEYIQIIQSSESSSGCPSGRHGCAFLLLMITFIFFPFFRVISIGASVVMCPPDGMQKPAGRPMEDDVLLKWEQKGIYQ